MTPARIAFVLLTFAPAPQPRPGLLTSDWPGWRGPERTGVSHQKGLLSSWPSEGPRLLWTVDDLGEGFSSPAVVGDRLYVMGSEKDQEDLRAYSVTDGKCLWSIPVGKVAANKGPRHPGPRATPSVDGGLLYALGSDGDLVCACAADGKVAWRKHLRQDFGGVPGNFAYCESVLVDGACVLCTPGGPKAAVLALDKRSGGTIWQTAVAGNNVAGFASPVVTSVGKVRLSVHFMAAGLVGVDTKTGKHLFSYAGVASATSASTPVVHGDEVFATATARPKGGDVLLRLSAGDGDVRVQEVYLQRHLMSAHGGAVRFGEHLYGTNDGGELLCLDFKTGAVKWRHRSGRGSLIVADGHIYLRGEAGQMALVKASPAGYVEKARFTQARRSRTASYAHPVVAGGRLYLRDGQYLFCYDVKGR